MAPNTFTVTGRFLFPRGVTVWHFIFIPPLVMGAVIALFRWIEYSLLDPDTVSGDGLYPMARILIISLVMSLVIAWLAFRHKREYEARIQAQNERLMEQERMAALGQMAAAVAHEIKNPLAGIRGGCEILLKAAGENNPRAELGEEMLYQVDRLNRSAHDLLAFARPKDIKPVPTRIHLIIDRVLKLIAGDPKNNGIRVDRNYDPKLGHVLVDPEQMEQVFFNILLNACQAMERNGTITISTGTGGDGDHVNVTVRDTGPGIPEDLNSKIFEPFFTTRAQGTGLGLAIVHKIIQDHGGSIRATPPADGGAGTEMVIQLPVEE